MFVTTKLTRATMIASLMGVGLGVSACGGSNDLVGFEREVPDEFTVVTRAPLVMPPDMFLRPPSAGARGPQNQQSYTQARSAVFGAPEKKSSNLTADEQTLLSRAQAEEVDPETRPSMDTSGSAPVQKDESFIDRLLFWRSGS